MKIEDRDQLGSIYHVRSELCHDQKSIPFIKEIGRI